MPGIIVVGLQFGDEGKGKVVDLFSQSASHVVRSQRGGSTGHTVIEGKNRWIFAQVPSGILNPQTHCYIAGGCALDPQGLIREMQSIESRGVQIFGRLHLSPFAQVILPALPRGTRVAQLIRPEGLREKFPNLGKDLLKKYTAYGELLRPFVSDVEGRLQAALRRDDTVIFEGEGGTFTDRCFGIFPHGSSFSALASGLCAGVGVGPTQIDQVLGVLKVYLTREDDGPFPTAIEGDYKEDFKEVGQRRVGWLDLVAARRAIALNGVEGLILTGLDTFDNFAEIKLCKGYHLDGQLIEDLPPLEIDLLRVEPVYEIFPGWQTLTRAARKIRDLPKNARAFVDAIEEFCNVPIMAISVGPERGQTIVIDEEWM